MEIILRNEEVVLRRFRDSDAKSMASLANNEKISRNLRDAFPHPYTINDAIAFIERFKNCEPLTYFAIEYKGEYAGNIALVSGTDVYRKSAEIGYFIGEPFWNKGIATIAVNLISDYGFKELDLIRIHTGVFDYNTASMRVLGKCGFKVDGIFKKAVIKNNVICDEIRFSKIRSD